MFSGIVEKSGKVLRHDRADGASRLLLTSGFSDLALGESIAVNGVCLTVAELGREGETLFFVSPETLSVTSLSRLGPDSRVNLERALPATGRLSGHIVQGHVDGVAKLVAVRESGDARELEFSLPQELGRYCVRKGSIALDGISLTLNSVRDAESDCRVTVMIVPHTWQVTHLCELKPGDLVNVETDMIAKHLERLCQPYKTP